MASPNPSEHTVLATGHALTIPEVDRSYIRYVSFWDVELDKDVISYRRYLQWWVHNLTFERAINIPQGVPGSNGRLVWLDLRWYDWSERAWLAVAERDPFTLEPGVPPVVAEALRQTVNCQKSEIKANGTRVVGAMVNGHWFIRETLETRRSPSYYDLLFSRFRFVEGKAAVEKTISRKVPYEVEEEVVEQEKDASGRLLYYTNGSPRLVRTKKKSTKYREVGERVTEAGQPNFVDFPKNIGDLEKAFGIDRLKEFGKERELSLDFGAIVAGGRDHPEEGSTVSLQNRLIAFQSSGFGRLAMRTFDVLETVGDRDYSETLIFKDGKYEKGDGADVVNDGGELLAYLPNGGQAGFLVNGEGERVEVAVADVANDVQDGVKNQGVRNPGSCWTCHAPSGGLIPPRDIEERDRRIGIKRKFKNKLKEQRYKEFFGGLEEGINQYTEPYEKLIERTTQYSDLPPGRKIIIVPWTGVEIGRMTTEIRDSYDAPVGLKRAVRMLGVPLPAFEYLCSRSPKHRLLQLLQGAKIPSRTWERDDYREMSLLLDAHRTDPLYQQASKP